MNELYVSRDSSYKEELVSRCEICGGNFIYAWGEKRPNGGWIITNKNDDPGAKQEDGRWTHNVCWENR